MVAIREYPNIIFRSLDIEAGLVDVDERVCIIRSINSLSVPRYSLANVVTNPTIVSDSFFH
jgi:hypothetical protein